MHNRNTLFNFQNSVFYMPETQISVVTQCSDGRFVLLLSGSVTIQALLIRVFPLCKKYCFKVNTYICSRFFKCVYSVNCVSLWNTVLYSLTNQLSKAPHIQSVQLGVGGVGGEGDPLRSFQKCQPSVSLHCAACWLRRTGSPDSASECLVPDFELEMPLTFHSHKTL